MRIYRVTRSLGEEINLIKSIEMEGMIDFIEREALLKKHMVVIEEFLKRDSVSLKKVFDVFFIDRLIERVKCIDVFIDLLKSDMLMERLMKKGGISIDGETVIRALGDFLENGKMNLKMDVLIHFQWGFLSVEIVLKEKNEQKKQEKCDPQKLCKPVGFFSELEQCKICKKVL